jgi:hypothetical protein
MKDSEISQSLRQHGPSRSRSAHRHRRFHVRPEALGRGYALYDLAPPDVPETLPAPATVAAQEALSEEEEAHKRARKGLLICIGILLFIFFSLFFDRLFGIYSWALDQFSVWPWLRALLRGG